MPGITTQATRRWLCFPQVVLAYLQTFDKVLLENCFFRAVIVHTYLNIKVAALTEVSDAIGCLIKWRSPRPHHPGQNFPPPPRAIEKQVQMQRPGAPVKVLPRHAFEVMGMFFKNPFLLHVLDRVHHR